LNNILLEMSTVTQMDGYKITVYKEPLGCPSFHVEYKKEYEVSLKISNFEILERKYGEYQKGTQLPIYIKKDLYKIFNATFSIKNKQSFWNRCIELWNDNNSEKTIPLDTKIPELRESIEMNIFTKLLQEALYDKQFDTTDDLVKAVKQILRQSDIPRHLSKSTKDKGFQETSRFGYSYSYINGNITISFFGVDKHDISTLARDFSNKDINYKYNDKTVQFLIKQDDNVKPDSLLSSEAKMELEDNVYDVLRTSIKEKSKIKDAISSFNSTQNRIYQELLKFNLVEWKYLKGDNGRYTYMLLPKEDQ